MKSMAIIVKSAENIKLMKNFPAKVTRHTSANPVLLSAGEASGTNDNKPLAESPMEIIKGAISWLKNRMKDKRPDVRALAKEQYEMRFPPGG